MRYRITSIKARSRIVSVIIANTAVLGGLGVLEAYGSVRRVNRPRLRAGPEDALEAHNETDNEKQGSDDDVAREEANDHGSVLLDEVVELAA